MLSTAVMLSRRERICDFCSDPNPVSTFQCDAVASARFSDLPDISSGRWSACETCARLIEREDWRNLADRATEALCRDDTIAKGGLEMVRREVLELHSLFRRHRRSPRSPHLVLTRSHIETRK